MFRREGTREKIGLRILTRNKFCFGEGMEAVPGFPPIFRVWRLDGFWRIDLN
jgi:hypothetical protein